MNKKISFAVLLFILSAIILSLSTCRKSSQKPKPFADRLPSDEESASRHALQPARPEDYGMVVFDSSNDVTSEAEANTLIRNKIKEIRSQFPKETLVKISEKIKEDPQRTKDKIRQIDEAIVKCRETLRKEPYNEEVKKKLQNLLMLKSIAQELPKK